MNRLINTLIILSLCGLCLHFYLANRTLVNALSAALEKTTPDPIYTLNQSLPLDAVRSSPKQAQIHAECKKQPNETTEKIETAFIAFEQQLTAVESQLDSASLQLKKELSQAQTEQEITSLLNTLKNIVRVDLPSDTLHHVLESSRDLSLGALLYVLDFIEGSSTHEDAHLLADYLYHQEYAVAQQAFTRLKELDKSSDVYQLLVLVSEQIEHETIRHEANQVLATINQSTY